MAQPDYYLLQPIPATQTTEHDEDKRVLPVRLDWAPFVLHIPFFLTRTRPPARPCSDLRVPPRPEGDAPQFEHSGAHLVPHKFTNLLDGI